MPSPAPCLVLLQHQLNHRWPLRRRQSDGIMGDPAHRLRRSDHNDGNALDVTLDQVDGPDLERMVEEFARQMRAFPAGRITYLIFDRRIAGRESNFAFRAYRGKNPHTGHCHISIAADQRSVIRPWTIQG